MVRCPSEGHVEDLRRVSHETATARTKVELLAVGVDGDDGVVIKLDPVPTRVTMLRNSLTSLARQMFANESGLQ